MIYGVLLANRLVSNSSQSIAIAESRTALRTDDRVLQIRADVSESDLRGRVFLVLERPLLDRAVDLPQIIDAGILLRGGAGADKVGDGDGSQQADNCDHDHDFHQRETRLAGSSNLHTVFVFLLCGVNETTGGLIISANFRSLIACRNRSSRESIRNATF